jgi:hypothetical protein
MLKLSKLVLIAALTAGGVSAAQAAPDTAKIAAKLQTASVSTSATTTAALPPSPTPVEKQILKAYYQSLSDAQQQALKEEFKDLTPKQQKALVRWWRDTQTSPS